MTLLEEVETYLLLEDERKSLSRQASDLNKQAEKIEARLHAHVLKHGGTQRALVVGPYALAVVDQGGKVQWKQKFVELHGERKAEELIAAAPGSTVLKVSQVDS
jgi:hypothetical protein